jgi:hypothetical protein
MHVTDWIPTLVSAGGNRFRGNVDGFDVWASLSNLQTSPRKEMLYNIDPYNGDTKLGNTKKRNKNAAIRVGNMKLIVGGISLTISSMLCFYQTSKNIPSYTKIFGKLCTIRNGYTKEPSSRLRELEFASFSIKIQVQVLLESLELIYNY